MRMHINNNRYHMHKHQLHPAPLKATHPGAAAGGAGCVPSGGVALPPLSPLARPVRTRAATASTASWCLKQTHGTSGGEDGVWLPSGPVNHAH